MFTTAHPVLRTTLALVLSAAAALAQALEVKPYTAQALAEAQAAGKPVAVHFHADWCGTCKQQEKAIAQLKGESGLDVTLLIADYDKEKDLLVGDDIHRDDQHDHDDDMRPTRCLMKSFVHTR